MERIFNQNIDIAEFRRQYGFLVLKPDALDHGIGEELFGIATETLYEDYNARLVYGDILEIKTESHLRLLYPHISEEDVWKTMKLYFLGNRIAVNVYHSNVSNMQEVIKNIKGARMRDWSLDQLCNGVNVKNFLRGILPIPGSDKIYNDILQKVINCKLGNKEIRFTDEEFNIYIRNLIHSPEGDDEYVGLIELMSEEHSYSTKNAVT